MAKKPTITVYDRKISKAQKAKTSHSKAVPLPDRIILNGKLDAVAVAYSETGGTTGTLHFKEVKTVTSPKPSYNEICAEFDQFAYAVRKQYLTVNSNKPIFTVDTSDLVGAYKASLTSPARSICNCNACFSFIKKFGGLVQLDDNNKLVSLMWPATAENAPLFRKATARLKAMVESRPLDTLAVFSDEVLGFDTSNPEHAHFQVPNLRRNTSTSSDEELRANFTNKVQQLGAAHAAMSAFARSAWLGLGHVLADTRLPNINNFRTQLRSLQTLRDIPNLKTNRAAFLQFVYETPSSAAHPRTTLLWKFLEDASGLNGRHASTTAEQSFLKAIDPTRYQRTTATPTEGELLTADKALNGRLALAMNRRKASVMEYFQLAERYSEARRFYIDRPPHSRDFGQGVFSARIYPTRRAEILRPESSSWLTFKLTLLRHVSRLEIVNHNRALSRNMVQLLTAMNPEAPSLFIYDNGQNLNPFSWFLTAEPQPLSMWNLDSTAMSWPCLGVAPLPSNLAIPGNSFRADPADIFFLQGANFLGNVGSPIFPQMLRPEHRPYRRAIEAHSLSIRAAESSDLAGFVAAGFMVAEAGFTPFQVRGTLASGQPFFLSIDRWV